MSVRIITVNLNGVRSAARKGFFIWLAQQNADVVCLQELKAQQADVEKLACCPPNYFAYFHFAEKKGYSGVAIYSRYEAKNIKTGLGFTSADQEGRYIAIDLGPFWVASLYMPSGTAGEHRQTIKFSFLESYRTYLKTLRESKKPYIICGDWNIAHKIIDLKNWRANQKHTGFLPEERAWMDHLFDEIGFVDAFRIINQEPEQYTWWSQRGRAREKNVGWRIDYQIISPELKDKIKGASIYTGEQFSDHAPLTVDYDMTL